MKLSEFKAALPQVNELEFVLPEGKLIPVHFHVTEVGLISRHFIDCGGKERFEKSVNFQLWLAADYEHRLSPAKLLSIIGLSSDVLKGEDPEIEIEYQCNTIGKYHVHFDGQRFQLQNTKTACLASDQCGAPAAKPKLKLAELQTENSAACCSPGGGCC
jgi:Family of unknown function (DUF6428)